MSLKISTQIKIYSSKEKVWRLLTDFYNYSQWNPFIKTISGEIEIGKKLKVSISPPNSKVMSFAPEILTKINDNELSWLGRVLLPGIFDGVHKFKIIDNYDGSVTFIQSEVFSGVLVQFFKSKLNLNTKAGFEQMNKSLKLLAETD